MMEFKEFKEFLRPYAPVPCYQDLVNINAQSQKRLEWLLEEEKTIAINIRYTKNRIQRKKKLLEKLGG
jgi:hypothetical protein